MDHLKVMAAQPFITGTLPPLHSIFYQPQPPPRGRSHKWNLLFFGLGGSALNNYFSQLMLDSASITIVECDPTLQYLATKWFGLVESPQNTPIASGQRVEIEEGSNWLAARPMDSPIYDVVYVDDCYYTREQNASCPRKAYHKPLVAAQLREALRMGGTLAMNVFSLAGSSPTDSSAGMEEKKHEWANDEHALLMLYNRYFADSCYYVKIASNMVGGVMEME